MKNICLLGATGSIGTNALEIIKAYSNRFRLVSFSFNQNITLGRQIIDQFAPLYVAVGTDKMAVMLQKEFPHVSFGYGIKGLIEAATLSEVDLVLTGLTGSVGLEPTLAAIEARKEIALANKETLVMGGELVMAAAAKQKVRILPVDSEHSAIFQCLAGQRREDVSELLITASGGSFRDYTREQLKGVTVEAALNHPNWVMGPKITIDSATMMNKGLEVIEARWLFGLNYDKIKVVLHRQSIIHSMVIMSDGAYLAQLGASDMREPIQYALTYPERLPIKEPKKFDLAAIGTLQFEELDVVRFPLLKLAFEVGEIGGTMPTALNGANEIAVAAFLEGRISYLEIEYYVQQAVADYQVQAVESLEQLLAEDQRVRQYVNEKIKEGARR
ncbi:1-deoxy-D-xylulose-5-phosphate reductoisomerase [Vagococcus sp. BWB3-3]|uniref:1-deoxy-D-xylulose 5-phosphate reductoisomerase n=1 Tax=Vagococcus allomyrinae TaxID=2794353 RepID=A0A940P7W5_9ENTE|nr:1-deoxy-D-xylulose-5-phosphate reductoisomerase [Vagococcus allomyrinae]MBP1043294.1 1-deoxy-D-xylulose-5-phosphate reductoisomerase [Vagococcus allomyrinae]